MTTQIAKRIRPKCMNNTPPRLSAKQAIKKIHAVVSVYKKNMKALRKRVQRSLEEISQQRSVEEIERLEQEIKNMKRPHV